MKESSRKKMGRKPKADPAIHRYGIKLTNEENVRFEAAFSESGMKEKAGFIKKSIFGGRIKVVKIDKATMDYYIKLTEFILFVARFKLGRYGKFYGYFDTITIGEA